MEYKTCTKCAEIFPIDQFFKDKRAKDGHRGDCKECNLAKSRKYSIENQDKIVANYYKKRTHKLAVSKAYNDSHKEELKAKAKIWEKANAAKRRAQSSAYYHRKRNAVPLWANSDAMEVVYAKAKRLSVWMGAPFEVDHIVPVTSVHVCGLHCETNLAIIPMADNQSKSNLHWPDMWGGYERLRPRNGTPGWYVSEKDVEAWYEVAPPETPVEQSDSNPASAQL